MRLLYLDFDEPLDVDELQNRIWRISEMACIELELCEVIPTKRGHHAIVAAQWSKDHPKKSVSDNDGVVHKYIPDLAPVEVVCLQLLLGSDPKRETFNLLRAHNLGDAPAFWQDRWNVLYAEKITE